MSHPIHPSALVGLSRLERAAFRGAYEFVGRGHFTAIGGLPAPIWVEAIAAGRAAVEELHALALDAPPEADVETIHAIDRRTEKLAARLRQPGAPDLATVETLAALRTTRLALDPTRSVRTAPAKDDDDDDDETPDDELEEEDEAPPQPSRRTSPAKDDAPARLRAMNAARRKDDPFAFTIEHASDEKPVDVIHHDDLFGPKQPTKPEKERAKR
jgi:hypothetical protein